MSMDKALLKKIYTFLGITFGVAWLGYCIAWGCGASYGGWDFDVVMWLGAVAPAIAMLFCNKSEGIGFDPEAWGVSPHFRASWQTYLFAYACPTLLAALTGLLYFASFPGQYDPTAQTFTQGLMDSGLTQEQAAGAVSSMLGMGVLAGPFANILLAVTELLGFQGWLLPKVRELFGEGSSLKASLVVSGVWAFWHAPLYFDGYFYGRGYPGAPAAGLLLGMVFYFLLGFLLCYMTLRTGCILPACLTRSGVTAMAVAAVYFCRGDSLLIVGPGLYGVFGCLALLVFCGLYVLRLLRLERSGKLWHQRKGKKK